MTRESEQNITTRLRPEWTYVNERFQKEMEVALGPNGTIVSVEPTSPTSSTDNIVLLPGRALMPGFVNAHSHAFQRAIRGQTHTRSGEHGDDFWSWRTAMYHVLQSMNPDELEAISRFAFMEMLLAGFTAVGEFHYVHHGMDGTPYEDPNELSKRVIRAARDVGIRIALLRVVYLRTGFDHAPPAEAQKRLIDVSLESALSQTDALLQWTEKMDDPCVSTGIAPHSVRAVTRKDLRQIGEWARLRHVPLHIHASEQPAEVEACRNHWGLTPIAALFSEEVLGENTTVIHATHVDEHDIEKLARTGTTVCVCPTTEADLGDGILPTGPLHEAGVSMALGTDSHAVIDPFHEMRSLEMQERLRTGGRVCLVAPGGEAATVAIQAATGGGARSLGLTSAGIEPGNQGDLIAIDLQHRTLSGWKPETLLAMLAFHGSAGVIRDVWVHGVHLVHNGEHSKLEKTRLAFESTNTAIGNR